MLQPPIPDNERQRLAALNSLGVLFTPAEERFDRITRLASRFLKVPIALVSLVAEKCQWFKSVQGIDATETPREISFCGHAILRDEPLIVEDALKDARFFDNPLVTDAPGIRFYAGQPIHNAEGYRIGTLCLIDMQPRDFSQEDQEILRDLAALVETELRHSQLSVVQSELIREKDEYQRKAMIDGLTRLWNRPAIMELLEQEIARAERGALMCVGLIDVDHFKHINDTYGHQAGDAVLSELARRYRLAVRQYDSIGRYGGEEFLIVFSDCNLETALSTAERLRRQVARLPISITSNAIEVTVSIGLAQFDSTHVTAEAIIGAADAALYRAKHNGRNRIEY